MSTPTGSLISMQRKTRTSVVRLAPCDGDYLHLTSDSLHDLASPINQVCILTDLVANRCQDTLDEESKVLFGHLQSSAKRLQNLLAGLRTYMQVVSTPATYRLAHGNVLLTGALAMLQQTINRNSALIASDRMPVLWCDPAQITYVFASLIDNSIKFRSERRPEIHVGVSGTKGTWVFSVRDNGIGIESRHINRIFGIFKRVHNEEYPGPGVGLAITKRVIERHGGQIWAESQIGQGATFFVELPKIAERRRNSHGRKRAASHRAVA